MIFVYILFIGLPTNTFYKMLLDFLKNNLKLPDEVCEALLTSWQYSKELNRGDFLIQTNQVEQYLYFIEAGTVGIFYPNEDQNQCVGFGYSPAVICSFPSFVKKKEITAQYLILQLQNDVQEIIETTEQEVLNLDSKIVQWKENADS